MRNRLVVFILLGVSLVFALLFARELILGKRLPRETFTERRVRILTYATFVNPADPGGEIIAAFKKQMHCDVEVSTATDAGLLLERLKLAPQSQPFDVVVGLDQLLLDAAAHQLQWKPVVLHAESLYPEATMYGTSPFVPFDWSPLGFIYRKGEVEPPREFAELVSPSYRDKFALQDPHLSSPGLQFVEWVRAMQGPRTVEFLEKFKPNVAAVAPSWAYSYGLFKKNQASFVFSYLTSLAYHWNVEKDMSYQFASFKEGHPVQVEYAAVPANCRECDLAMAFVQYLLEPDNQRLIMNKNFMFPALKNVVTGDAFAALPQVKIRAAQPGNGKHLRDWDKVFGN